MNNQLPAHIESEHDLDMLSEYLDNNTAHQSRNNGGNMSLIPHENDIVPHTLGNTAFMPAFLTKHIGKLMKIESLIGDRLETKIGILVTVGAGYIVLRQLNTNNTVICDMIPIKYATIVHNNSLRQLFQ